MVGTQAGLCVSNYNPKLRHYHLFHFIDILSHIPYIHANFVKKKSPIRPKSSRRSPLRPTIAEIDLQAIAFNLKGVRARVGRNVRIMAVVKANAYGHGIEGVSKYVERSLADYFGVAFVEEGTALRRAGIRKPVHVFALPSPNQASLFVDGRLEPTVCTAGNIRVLQSAAARGRRTLAVHVKIDTGMNRIGVKRGVLPELLKELGKANRVEIKGVFTHFANSDEKEKGFMNEQLREFESALEYLSGQKVEPELIHCANSAAILDAPQTYFSMVRPGVMMYGCYPSRTTSESIPLRPAMTIKTRTALVKWIEQGESVSYGRRYYAARRTKIATLPIGYADGFSRLLSGKATALIGGKEYPVAGTICMDQLMVDVGEDDVAEGAEAILVGSQGERNIGLGDLAGKIGTIPYEICCAISSRVPRVYRS